jgi:hypothetical protein
LLAAGNRLGDGNEEFAVGAAADIGGGFLAGGGGGEFQGLAGIRLPA